MNAFLLMFLPQSLKRQVIFVIIIVSIITSLPVMAVLALGSSTLAILNIGSGSSQADGLYQGAVSTTDTYDYGNCTYWASLLREQTNHPIPNTWGNANTWAIRALLDGYRVDHIPEAGAIMQTTAGKLGHVAYVESVDPTYGAWTISEMNAQGFDIVDERTLPASQDKNYNFIH